VIRGNPWLVVGGVLSLVASLLHFACIFGGPDWYRFFGAGERMARMAEAGRWTPAVITAGIATLLAVVAAYAFSGAGLIRQLPFLRTGLVVIAAVYMARGLILLKPSALARPDLPATFLFWSSLIVLILGLIYVIGIWQTWPTLSQGTTN
jgi:hypothetical protein